MFWHRAHLIGGSFLMVTILALPSAQAGIAYPDPAGGWAYSYAGALDAFGNPGAVADNAGAGRNALDGLWTHDNGSDSWGDTVNGAGLGDRLGAGVGLLGGVQSITEADAGSPGGQVTFLRQMDAITAGGASNDNRRTYFMKDLATLPGFTPTFMDTGVTLTFRARLTPDAALEGTRLVSANKGATVGGDGKGMFGLRQSSGDEIVTFSLHQVVEDTNDTTGTLQFASAGLTLNKNVQDTGPSNAVGNASSTAIPQNNLALDPNVWHEFWVTVQANDATAGNGTHTATIYMDGSLTGTSFNFTAGNGDDTGALPVGSTTNYLELGHNFTPLVAAFDTDFYSVQFGAIAPVPEPSTILLLGLGGLGLAGIAWRRRNRS